MVTVITFTGEGYASASTAAEIAAKQMNRWLAEHGYLERKDILSVTTTSPVVGPPDPGDDWLHSHIITLVYRAQA